jgi:hypothetical protein
MLNLLFVNCGGVHSFFVTFRSNSEERVWESSKRMTGDSSTTDSADTIRRVSSHEDFNSVKHHHILSKLQKDMGHGLVNIFIALN